jgi:hypothetical protein
MTGSRTGRVIMLAGFFMLLSCIQVFSQLPVVRARFANPIYDESAGLYRVDVEFQSDKPGLEIFGVNLRFLYDHDVLKFEALKNFRGSYRSLGQPEITTGIPTSGNYFGFKGPASFLNGAVQLKSKTNPLRLSTDGWTILFSARFKVLDPSIFSNAENAPFLVWDLKSDPEEGGYLRGDDGLVITSVDPSLKNESFPVKEVAETVSLLPVMGTTAEIVHITDENGLKVWPNPTVGPVNIDLNWKGIPVLGIKIYDVLGKVVFRRDFKSGESIRFDLSPNVSGNYMIEMIVNGVKFNQKLVLDRK